MLYLRQKVAKIETHWPVLETKFVIGIWGLELSNAIVGMEILGFECIYYLYWVELEPNQKTEKSIFECKSNTLDT